MFFRRPPYLHGIVNLSRRRQLVSLVTFDTEMFSWLQSTPKMEFGILAPSIYYWYPLLCLLVPVDNPMYGIDRYAFLSGMKAVRVTGSSAGGRIVL